MAQRADELRDTDDDGDVPDPEDVPVAGRDVSTEDYRKQQRTTRWVVLPDQPMKMKIVQTTPFKLLQSIQEYELEGIMSRAVEEAEQASEGVEVDTSGVGGQEVENLGGFMQNFVADRVLTPTGYWGDVPEDEPDGFDLSELSDNDMDTLIAALAGVEQGANSGFRPGTTSEEPHSDRSGASRT